MDRWLGVFWLRVWVHVRVVACVGGCAGRYVGEQIWMWICEWVVRGWMGGRGAALEVAWQLGAWLGGSLTALLVHTPPLNFPLRKSLCKHNPNRLTCNFVDRAQPVLSISPILLCSSCAVVRFGSVPYRAPNSLAHVSIIKKKKRETITEVNRT